MNRLPRQVVALAVLAVAVFAITSVIMLGIYVLAFIAPVMGFVYAGVRFARARRLWESHGRFPVGDAIRIIGAGRARVLGAIELLDGAGGFSLSLVAPALVYGPKTLLIPALAIGMGIQVGVRIARRRVALGAHPVDVLPPE